MTDRELLEKAARAAGLKLQPAGRTDGEFLVLMNEDGDYIWNPRTDDGDALRLAVKLEMIVDMHGMYVRVCHPFGPDLAIEPKGSDPHAATRRAIVRAAAQMDKDGE